MLFFVFSNFVILNFNHIIFFIMKVNYCIFAQFRKFYFQKMISIVTIKAANQLVNNL
ncbi:hypothetical protein Daes_2630 [Pseudodesulfovibrio aespoeensis Aspo-2]|uniref:Uncharacterized protein n=1 Tax=Pseudodesulfovibrio aespoeensis (strain ATCC 700646 / DSM 10631 / Aspo-2) TaxID=643562 RepID=E6VW66_PSEA9|nr:hypothetical protein Daes_2630 [Pseudodesulfovibrio aespoeensis Aspo-2]